MGTRGASENGNEPPIPGLVWLVGAGPGDPGLVTHMGIGCIMNATVVIYDSLINPALLEFAQPSCEVIYAGKRAGQHSMTQDEINELISAKALEGNSVCRLKGGDPFVFGRGGEEALHLREKGIPFQIVPGVTSAVAVPAYAGIPVTHRGLAASVRVITGHEAPDKAESDLDWDEIAATEGTLVFLMGVRNLPVICERLMAGGRRPETPVALISNGTRPSQQTVTGTLADIVERIEASGLKPPAVIVVGEVVALRDQLKWFEQSDLFGRRIVVTRARAQTSDLRMMLASFGAEVICAPTIRIESLADTPAMRKAVREAGSADWCVFTSANGVDAFVEALTLEDLDVRVLAGVKLAAIGPPTAGQMRKTGLRADLVPERYVAEGLLEAFDARGPISGQRFLLPRSEIARATLADGLRERGGIVDEVAAYRTHSGDELSGELLDELERGEIDLVTFTSSSTVTNFVEALPAARREAILKQVRGASIGPITSETMRKVGIAVTLEASKSTILRLVTDIHGHFRNPSEKT